MLTFVAYFAIGYLIIVFVIYLLILTRELQGKPFFRTRLDNFWIDSAIFAILWLLFLLFCPLVYLGTRDDD